MFCRRLLTNVKFVFTFEAVGHMSVCWIWVASLVFVLVERADPQHASSTLRQGNIDGVPDTTIRQPAVVTPIKSRPPGCKQMAGRRQHSILFLTLLFCLLPSEFIPYRRRIEDLTCEQRRRTHRVRKITGINFKKDFLDNFFIIFFYFFYFIAMHIVFLWCPYTGTDTY